MQTTHSSFWQRLHGPVSCFVFLLLTILSFPSDLSDPSAVVKGVDILMGVELCAALLVFIRSKNQRLLAILSELNDQNQRFLQRGECDGFIKQLCASYFATELTIQIGSVAFTFCSMVLIYLQMLTVPPYELLLNMQLIVTVVPFSNVFWFSICLQFAVTLHMGIFLSSSMFMIGNIYNQLILHLEVLDHDIQLFEQRGSVSPEEAFQQFRQFIITYRSLVGQLNTGKALMRGLFINNITVNMMCIVLACIEFAIVFQEDPQMTFRILFYFALLSILFFYWCHLGNRLAEKVSDMVECY